MFETTQESPEKLKLPSWLSTRGKKWDHVCWPLTFPALPLYNNIIKMLFPSHAWMHIPQHTHLLCAVIWSTLQSPVDVICLPVGPVGLWGKRPVTPGLWSFVSFPFALHFLKGGKHLHFRTGSSIPLLGSCFSWSVVTGWIETFSSRLAAPRWSANRWSYVWNPCFMRVFVSRLGLGGWNVRTREELQHQWRHRPRFCFHHRTRDRPQVSIRTKKMPSHLHPNVVIMHVFTYETPFGRCQCVLCSKPTCYSTWGHRPAWRPKGASPHVSHANASVISLCLNKMAACLLLLWGCCKNSLSFWRMFKKLTAAGFDLFLEEGKMS